ncbi:uncharacterized protein LOC127114127 [Lathyrus oleraceus]|uniref:uncharacterized protein LOC127114127 n=1 Tax=Pisum sativum TaxID=3888 RepID=UPI0021D1EE5B|nr:uncharacterized protein LOC127114127 [Pisum sativum]
MHRSGYVLKTVGDVRGISMEINQWKDSVWGIRENLQGKLVNQNKAEILEPKRLRALVSSTPTLRSINLSMCSLLTSASLYILTESLKSLLKELYLDHCLGIDAALIVPALVELEHLEVLSVAGIPTVSDTFVKDYIVARGHNMKELILKDCINLTDASIKVIIAEHCPAICGLDLSNVCKLTDMSMGYLTNICHVLHSLKLCRNSFRPDTCIFSALLLPSLFIVHFSDLYL